MKNCSKTNFFRITSIADVDGDVKLYTNQPIVSNDIPNCLTLRFSSCVSQLIGYEDTDLIINVNGEDVNVLNRYGSNMKYGELILNYVGCLNTRYTYYAYIGTSDDIDHLLISNAPKCLVN